MIGIHVKTRRPTILLVDVLILIGLISCGAGDRGSGRPESVLLIIVDTLRADRLGCMGYPHAATPNIDRLAEEGALFTEAVTTCPETGPATVSLLTSRFPFHHGVRENTDMLSEHVVTMAEILRRQGYQTGAFWDKFPFDQLRYFQGFSRLEKRTPDTSSRDAAVQAAVGGLLEWLAETKNKKTFTLFHLFDPHMPYEPVSPSPRTRSLGYQGRFRGDFEAVIPLWYGWGSIEPSDIEFMSSLYDDEIGFVDRCLGEVLKKMEDLGLTEKTLIVFTADHGESLGEHDYYFDHGDCLYENQIRVPLIIRYAQMPQPGRRISWQVRSIDVLPTVFHILGIDNPHPRDGTSLLPLIWGRGQMLATRYAYCESDSIHPAKFNNRGFVAGIEGKHLAVRGKGRKLVYVPGRPQGEFSLFDLRTDPGETVDLFGSERKEAAEMVDLLFRWKEKDPSLPPDRRRISEEARRILESLHYIK